MKKLLALDIGEVCIKLNHNHCLQQMNWAEMRDIPPRLLGAADDLECGRMEEEDFYSLVCRELNIPDIDEVREWFYSILGDEMPGIADTLNRIKNDWDFVFLSDISGAHLQLVAEKLSFFNMAVGGIYSFEVGAKKPAKEMYLAFKRKFGNPDLYIDDRAQNIRAALELGWQARQFTSAEDFDRLFI